MIRFLPLVLLVACGKTPESVGDVPTGEKDLVPWLEDGNYLDYVAEDEVHESAGPHFGGVRSFFDPILVGTAEGASEWDPGSAAIKELYGDSEDVLGWAVMVKLDAGTSGDTWYWFEIFEDDVLIDDVGAGVCVGCHSAGTDHLLSEVPE